MNIVRTRLKNERIEYICDNSDIQAQKFSNSEVFGISTRNMNKGDIVDFILYTEIGLSIPLRLIVRWISLTDIGINFGAEIIFTNQVYCNFYRDWIKKKLKE